MAITWDDLFLKGSIVDLAHTTWPARISIKPADLGIQATTEVDAALSFGAHRLVPRGAFVDITAAHAKAVRIIEANSLPFMAIRGARYVPDARVAELAAELKKVRAEWQAAVDAFVGGYGERKAEMLATIREALLQAAKTREAAETAMDRLREAYPSRDEVAERFSLSWKVYTIAGARVAGAAAALQDEAQDVRSALSDMISSLRRDTADKIADLRKCIANGGAVTQRSIDSALVTLDRISAVNVMGDVRLAREVEALRALVKGFRPDEEVKAEEVRQLEEIKATIEADTEAAIADAEARMLGIGRRRVDRAA